MFPLTLQNGMFVLFVLEIVLVIAPGYLDFKLVQKTAAGLNEFVGLPGEDIEIVHVVFLGTHSEERVQPFLDVFFGKLEGRTIIVYRIFIHVHNRSFREHTKKYLIIKLFIA